MRSSLCPLLLLLASTAVSAQTPCAGHFVNRSNYQWSISGYDGTQNKLMIAPGATVDVPYANATAVIISGYVPNRTYTKQFQLQAGTGGCFTILYKGNPGYIAINKPNPGDVVTCAGGC